MKKGDSVAKKQHWKKAIRAQVAATMQGGGASLAAQTPAPTTAIAASTSGSTASHAGAVTIGYHHDLVRIIWVAGILLILLIAAAITDQKTGWLDQLATQLSATWSQPAAEQSLLPTAADTAPAGAPAASTSPTAPAPGA